MLSISKDVLNIKKYLEHSKLSLISRDVLHIKRDFEYYTSVEKIPCRI